MIPYSDRTTTTAPRFRGRVREQTGDLVDGLRRRDRLRGVRSVPLQVVVEVRQVDQRQVGLCVSSTCRAAAAIHRDEGIPAFAPQ